MRSVARYQSCIFCGSVLRNGTVHSIGKCVYWRDLRHSFMQAAGISLDVSADVTTGLMLRCSPSTRRFEGAVRFGGAIDEADLYFWRAHGRVVEL